ncbi:MAG: universal stress protein, partial [Dehalococcoidales bacterium]|nr:universal stress protein [Dehalococcoidales bacterium]
MDGSKLAEVVLHYAKELAGRLDLEVIILHVCIPEERALTTMHRAYVERMAEIVRGQSFEVQQRTGFQ